MSSSTQIFVDSIKNHPTANLMANQKAVEEITDDEKAVLTDLRQTYIESTELEILQHKSIFEVEIRIDEDYKRVYDARREILAEFKEGPLRKFWMTVFNAAGILLTEDDEKILAYLLDVRSKMFSEPRVKMLLEFEFEKNPYFNNLLLTKTYYIKCNADPKNAVFYDGIEITSTEGTHIDWLVKHSTYTAEEDRQYSFFDFFDDHSDSENVNRAILGEEIAFGFFLREKVIPKAIYFFTGDIRIQRVYASSEELADDDNAGAGDIDADYDGDSEGDAAWQQTEQQQYTELKNEFDAKELAENEQEKQRICAVAVQEVLTASEEEHRRLNETEKQPLIDACEDS